MKVYKFGGASINSLERIRNLATILSDQDDNILLVISAIGKTTNALERVAEAFYRGEQTTALELFKIIKDEHIQTLKMLVHSDLQKSLNYLESFFTEIEWMLHDKPVKEYSYYYDQIVCIGELLSTSIVSSYLSECNIQNNWIDVRDIFRTDDTFQEATIDWRYTQQKVNEEVLPLFNQSRIVITQGFIGATDENESTTLGREGSDYTAAVFANMLNAHSLTIWKDVPGVMSADPKEFTDAIFLPALSYHEVIEMAYYGAQVIHPKTIKPIENKNIPLQVRCFLQPENQGTLITQSHQHFLPPVKVIKKHQVLVTFSSTDFSFVGEKLIAALYELFSVGNIRPNLMQSTAISILCTLDDVPEKIEKLALSASELFNVQLEKNLTLLTIRHYTDDLVKSLIKDKIIVLEQRTTDTLQILMRD